ncbi:hypothetical protein CWC21_01260 [Pseudoalteromonas phenolica]|nr:hypothetical protein CWC21_01260 [Pseudoalteromonas phenolica]
MSSSFSQEYQSSIILNHFKGLKLTLTSLKISYLEQLNSKIFASLSTSFPCLKIVRLIKRIGIRNRDFLVALLYC